MRTINDITPDEWDSLNESTAADEFENICECDFCIEDLFEESTDPYPNNVEDELHGVKFDEGKRRMDLIPSEMLLALADPLTHGAQKYADNNWRKGLKYSRVLGAAMRHLTAWTEGVNIDSDSGLNHIDQAMLNLGFLATFEREERGYELDDLYGRNK